MSDSVLTRIRLAVAASTLAAGLLVGGLAIGLAVDGGSATGEGSLPIASPFSDGPDVEQAVVWAVGDGADGSRISKRVAGLVPPSANRFLYLGDVYAYGTAGDFISGYAPVYGHLYPITAPVIGNHDWAARDGGYRPFWSAAARGRPPDYYAFELAGWELVALNSEGPHGPASRQVRWLRSELSEPGTCRIAFMHRPRFNAGEHGDAPDLEPIWQVLRGHAAVVLSGHDHNSQRLHPIDGMVQLVAGAGGHGLYRVDHDDPRLAFADDRHYAALELRLGQGDAMLSFISSAGDVLDRHAIDCQPLDQGARASVR